MFVINEASDKSAFPKDENFAYKQNRSTVHTVVPKIIQLGNQTSAYYYAKVKLLRYLLCPNSITNPSVQPYRLIELTWQDIRTFEKASDQLIANLGTVINI